MYLILCMQHVGTVPYLAFDEDGREPFISNNKARSLDHLEYLRRTYPEYEYSLYSKEAL